MPPTSRAARLAREISAKHSLDKLPINIREVAQHYAHVVVDPLPADVSGMLIPAAHTSKGWIIAVNKKDVPERQRFSIAHELAHLLLHDFSAPHADGVKEIRYRNTVSSTGTNIEEIEANRFAAEILLPSELLIPRLEALGLDWDGAPSKVREQAIEDLAALCKVSQQALLLRIGTLLH